MSKRSKRKKGPLGIYWELWNSPDTFIFQSSVDAILGIIVLVLIPTVSLLRLVVNNSIVWASYGSPLVCVSFAALYDCYGRYKAAQGDDRYAQVKRSKVLLRVGIHAMVLLSACLICGYNALLHLRWIPFLLLAVAGFILSRECWWRLRQAE